MTRWVDLDLAARLLPGEPHSIPPVRHHPVLQPVHADVPPCEGVFGFHLPSVFPPEFASNGQRFRQFLLRQLPLLGARLLSAIAANAFLRFPVFPVTRAEFRNANGLLFPGHFAFRHLQSRSRSDQSAL